MNSNYSTYYCFDTLYMNLSDYFPHLIHQL